MQDRRTVDLERQLARAPNDLTAWVELARHVRHTRELPESLRDGRHVGALFRAWAEVPEERILDLLTLDYLGLRAVPGPGDQPPTYWSSDAAARDRESWFDRVTGAPLRVRLDALRLELVWVPAGEHPEDPERRRLAHGLYMSVLPITEAAFRAVMSEGLADEPLPPLEKGGDLRPWVGPFLAAGNFLVRLTRRWAGLGPLPPGWRLRLPTLTEWRYATFAQSTLPPPGLCWADFAAYGRDEPRVAVGGRASNGFGLVDMCGNCDEWTMDPDEDGPRGDLLLGLAPRPAARHRYRHAVGGRANLSRDPDREPPPRTPGILDRLLGDAPAPRPPPWSPTLHDFNGGDVEGWAGIRLVLEPPPATRLQDLDLMAPPSPSWTRRIPPWNPGGEVVDGGDAGFLATSRPITSRRGRWTASLCAEPVPGRQAHVTYRVQVTDADSGEFAQSHEWSYRGEGPRPGSLRFSRDERRLFLVAAGTSDHYLTTFDLGP